MLTELLQIMETPETVTGVLALLGGGAVTWLLADRKDLKAELKQAYVDIARLNKEANETADSLRAIEKAILTGKTE